ncbi:MAG: CopG family transcriptional regulator [Spirochaetaceae bacterium]|nr:CopG family transcriptional regulator [Spirochaetaceae bacterium]
MRTTINVNDDLLSRAKLCAVQTDRTLTAVIEDALRIALDGPHRAAGSGDDLPVDGSGGPLPGIDLDDTSALLDRMEGLG